MGTVCTSGLVPTLMHCTLAFLHTALALHHYLRASDAGPVTQGQQCCAQPHTVEQALGVEYSLARECLL